MSSKKAKRRQRRADASGGPAKAAPVPRADNGAGAKADQPKGVLDRLAASAFGAKKPQPGEPASMGKRFFAYLIDWYAGALVTNIPISIVAGGITGSMLNQKLADLGPLGMLAGAGGVVLAVCYYVLVPAFIWKGQTPAKRLLGLRIDALDGSPASLRQLVLRQVAGLMVLEGVLVTASSVWHQMLGIATGIDFVTYLMYAGYAVVALSVGMMLITKDHRCLHDYIGSTRVDAA